MNDSGQFIIDSIKELLIDFPDARILYEFQEDFDSHILEVLPGNLNQDKDFIEKSEAIVDKFYCDFPGELMYFVDPNGMNKIKTPLLVFNGKNRIDHIELEVRNGSSSPFFNINSMDYIQRPTNIDSSNSYIHEWAMAA